MKQIQKRMILQVVLGFLIGRTDIFGLNPAGVAYFAAGFTEGGSVFAVALAVFLGMASSSINMEMAVCWKWRSTACFWVIKLRPHE